MKSLRKKAKGGWGSKWRSRDEMLGNDRFAAQGDEPLNWQGDIPTLKAQELLQGLGPGQFLTRFGENGNSITVRLDGASGPAGVPIRNWAMKPEGNNVTFTHLKKGKPTPKSDATPADVWGGVVPGSTIAEAIKHLLNDYAKSMEILGIKIMPHPPHTPTAGRNDGGPPPLVFEGEVESDSINLDEAAKARQQRLRESGRDNVRALPPGTREDDVNDRPKTQYELDHMNRLQLLVYARKQYPNINPHMDKDALVTLLSPTGKSAYNHIDLHMDAPPALLTTTGKSAYNHLAPRD